jgi:hypothetical protein
MRRLLVLLLAMVAFGGFTPPAPAHASHRHDTGMAMPDSCSHDEGQCATHVCLGCVVQPTEPPMPVRLVPLALPPTIVSAPSFVPGRPPGFEPPPPRTIG